MFKRSSGAEHATELLWIFVAGFAATLHGAHLAGTVAGKTGKKIFGVDKKLTQEQNGMNRPEQNIG